MRPPRPAPPARAPGRGRTLARRRGDVVSRLPGLLARYRVGATSGWPDEIGGIGDGVHTGSPSTVTADGATGMAYDGSTQFTTIGDVSDLAFIHQTWTFGISAWLRWDGPSNGSNLHVALGSTSNPSESGFFVGVEDRAIGGGPGALRAFFLSSQGGTTWINARSGSGAVAVGAPTHVVATGNGSDTRLFLNGSLVDTQSVIATDPGNADRPLLVGRCNGASPFGFEGDVFDVAFGTADWSDYAAAIHAAGPG